MIAIGLDEVGRGCWAGPLVAAAVALPPDHAISGLDDSKKLRPAQRAELDLAVRGQALAIGVGWVWPAAIDISGITWAVKTAMEQAYAEMYSQLVAALHLSTDTVPMEPDIVIDGNYNFLSGVAGARTVVGADGLVPAVSAASIIAKVARDNYMATVAALEYPDYGFDKHVGYGTAQHIAALGKHGVTPIHRASYKPIQALLLQSGT